MTPTDLVEIELIKRLKYKYMRCLDQKRWDELAHCFTPDATVDYGSGRYSFQGVDAIMQFLRTSLGEQSGTVGIHHGGHPEIELLSATTARGSWVLWNFLFNAAQKRNIRIGAYYADEYVKVGAEWKIRHTGYRALFHEEWSRDDTPSVRVLVPG